MRSIKNVNDKRALLAGKRAYAENAYAAAVAEQKSASEIAFAATGLHVGSDRGKAAQALCALGAGVHTYEKLARVAGLADIGVSVAAVRFVAEKNFPLRRDLVRLHVSMRDKDVVVRVASREEIAKAIAVAAQCTNRKAAQVAELSKFRLAPSKKAQLALPAPNAAA